MSAHNKDLFHLSNEVSRIAATLAQLSNEPEPPTNILANDAGAVPDIAVDVVRSVIRARRLRKRYFDEELFADPAWDMMLELLYAEIAHRRITVSSLCIAAEVPATTGLRWLKAMVNKGLFIRRSDPLDGRRVYVELAPSVSSALRLYFSEITNVPTV